MGKHHNTTPEQILLRETAPQRACREAESVRKNSSRYYWGGAMVAAICGALAFVAIEVLGSKDHPLPTWVAAIFIFVGGFVGFAAVHLAVLSWKLASASFNQRNEARQELERLLTSSVKTEWVMGSQKISLEVENTSPNTISLSAKMLSIRYAEQGISMLSPNGEYDIPWANTRLVADANWRTILPNKKDFLNLATLDGVKGEGRAKEYGDGAVVILPHVDATNCEASRIVADLGSTIEYQLEIYSAPSFTKPVLLTRRVKVVRQEVSPGEKNFDPKWELVSEAEEVK